MWNHKLHFLFAQEGDVYTALCLDFDLAAQGDSMEDAAERISSMVAGYLEDALFGDDQDCAEYFLGRKAPWNEWVWFYACKGISLVKDTVKSMTKPFPVTMIDVKNFSLISPNHTVNPA